MGHAVDMHRLHFAFTITFHYIFPQLTMGLAFYSFTLRRNFFAPATNTTIVLLDFGQASSESTLPSESSLGSRWNFSLVPTGRNFPRPPAA